MWRDSTATPSTPLSGRWDLSGKVAGKRRATLAGRGVHVQLWVHSRSRARWRAAAQAAGVSLSLWISQQCEAAIPPLLPPLSDDEAEIQRDADAAERMRAARAARASSTSS